MAAAAAGNGWTPYNSLTQAPTNLKEAIDWVLRVTGKDGKKNEAAKPPQFACLCFLAKAVKDLLYDAKDPGSPGPSTHRNWDDLLLEQEKTLVLPVLKDLGLLSGSTGAARDTCAGGTEVIGTLIDQLAQGLQKWVGWQETDDDCCLKGTNGIGKKCTCPGTRGGTNCCNSASAATTCHECSTCGTSANGDTANKCYLSAYCKKNSTSSGGSPTEGDYYWPTISSDSTKVHLLARIFLGSVCLIWSGLSQLGFLTGGSGSNNRWKDSKLNEIKEGDTSGLGSFMAAMGYDLDRLNGSGSLPGTGKKGAEVAGMLSKAFSYLGNGTSAGSVAEYYSSIYSTASAAKGSAKSTESICKQYPLLVLHILASGYFRAGSAGAKGITSPKAQQKTDDDASKKPRHPRTIREILYWLSALPYSKGYKALVERMQQKYPKEEGNPKEFAKDIKLYDTSAGVSTTLKRDCITHYLMAACGYCPLVLIGIQGTIATSGTDSDTSAPVGKTENKRCEKHKEKPHERCKLDDKKTTDTAPKAAGSTGQQLQLGQVCYGGYHLAVKDFGPLHGMYANGLFGFDMGGSAAQCLDQLRIYVYHCFYQLYFLRKQCKEGVVVEDKVLGWQSCRYGSGLVGAGKENWICQKSSTSNGKCNCHSSTKSPLMLFLCDSVEHMHCGLTKGKGVNDYPEIDDHIEAKDTIQPPHFGKPPMHCPVPMGWQAESTGSSTSGGQNRENHFKDLNNGTHKTAELQPPASVGSPGTYPAHCTGNTLSLLLEYYCDPVQCPSGTLVVLLRLMACITPTVPRTLGDLFGFYYYIVYIGGKSGGGGGYGDKSTVSGALGIYEKESRLYMLSVGGGNEVVEALGKYGGDCKTGKQGTLNCLIGCTNGGNSNHCTPFLSPLSGQQYGQLSPLMAGTYLSWLVYLIEGFEGGLQSLVQEYKNIQCKEDCTKVGQGAAGGCGGNGECRQGTHGNPCGTGGANQGVCGCTSVVSCTGVLPVLYKYGFGYGNVTELHKTQVGNAQKKCHEFLSTLEGVKDSGEFTKLTNSINQLIYTTRLPWIFVLTVAWLMAVLYLAFGAIWPLDWTHMRSHCRGLFRKGSLSPWEVLMVGKKKGRGILEFFGKT
ncbi:variant erythrocyte surface antigen-1 beta subunit [Babesia bovis T2Bo]|uniref:variant erythrocyte surface antigen-1 beta subunit n=1 Tax=Babesia bovis T2Bo TaxID=484906 RepID=UPI001C35CAEE|nr:variant erythrocyte surface antigen-1 beta subunit [Babesia bovis T2Bo]EDO08747.2 variant erythrocyte surface antigen-1 beta subunit [Babesia bovis T2Bo]